MAKRTTIWPVILAAAGGFLSLPFILAQNHSIIARATWIAALFAPVALLAFQQLRMAGAVLSIALGIIELPIFFMTLLMYPSAPAYLGAGIWVLLGRPRTRTAQTPEIPLLVTTPVAPHKSGVNNFLIGIPAAILALYLATTAYSHGRLLFDPCVDWQGRQAIARAGCDVVLWTGEPKIGALITAVGLTLGLSASLTGILFGYRQQRTWLVWTAFALLLATLALWGSEVGILLLWVIILPLFIAAIRISLDTLDKRRNHP